MRSSRNGLNPPPDFIPGLTAWANKHPSVRAVLLTSTRAVPGASVDLLSDYDVILVVKNITPWVKNHAWLSDFGEVIVDYWDPVHPDPFLGIDMCANVVQYRDGLKIDFTLWSQLLLQQIAQYPTLPKELDAGYRILVDKDRLTAGIKLPTGMAYVPKPPTPEEYLRVINDFLSDAPYVAKCLWRDDLMPAKWCLDYDMKHIYLRPMLEWLVEVQHAWSIPVGYLGKGLKKYLPADIWAALEKSYAGGTIEENWAALWQTMELYREVATDVGKSLGFTYPAELHLRVADYIAKIRKLSRA